MNAEIDDLVLQTVRNGQTEHERVYPDGWHRTYFRGVSSAYLASTLFRQIGLVFQDAIAEVRSSIDRLVARGELVKTKDGNQIGAFGVDYVQAAPLRQRKINV